MDECRKQFEAVISKPPYEKEVGRYPEDPEYSWPGNYRDYSVQLAWCMWQAAWNRRESGQVEPVAWMHNLPGRVDVIHTEVKNLLARQAVESHQGFHRPLDKTEHYTIPLYDHAKPCERCKELEEQVHFQSCLTRDLLPYQDEAVKGRDKLAALEAENARLRVLERDCEAQHGDLVKCNSELHATIAQLRAEAKYWERNANEANAANRKTIAQQAEQLAAAESRLHDVATHCATVEQQLAAAEKDAERYRWLRSNHPIHDNSPFICRNFGAAFSQWTDDQADKAIDAAIAASREGKS